MVCTTVEALLLIIACRERLQFMEKQTLQVLSDIINEEITNYGHIRTLYEEKKDILIANKVDELLNIDLAINEKLQSIKRISTKRKYITNKSSVSSYAISTLMAKAKDVDTGLYQKFAEQKKALGELAKKIAVLEKTNIALVRQGMQINNKLLNNFFQLTTARPCEYNAKGQNNKIPDISSIVENA